jgi:tripartite-type tricarboxylate transporter receptor subunit TctC
MIVAFAAGGVTDVIGRLLAERMRTSLGQPVIIENVSGANGTIGTRRAALARPDGYTINLGPMAAHVLNAVYYSLPYDVLNDFAPISPVAMDSFFSGTSRFGERPGRCAFGCFACDIE